MLKGSILKIIRRLGYLHFDELKWRMKRLAYGYPHEKTVPVMSPRTSHDIESLMENAAVALQKRTERGRVEWYVVAQNYTAKNYFLRVGDSKDESASGR